MDRGNDPEALWLPLSEAASRMGLTVDGLRSRIRRGLVTTRRGNDRRLLVPISTDVLANGHDQDEQVHDRIHDRPAVDHELFDDLHAQLAELRVALARAEERLAAGERRETDLQGLVTHLRTEQAKLATELAEARKGWLERLLEAIRRR
jgi:hypothetical protein